MGLSETGGKNSAKGGLDRHRFAELIPLSHFGRRAAGAALLVVIAIIGIGLRTPFLLAADCINSDPAMIVLMARHFARGEITPFLWGQRFMGPLEPLLLTPLAWMGWATPFSQSVLAMALVLAQSSLCALLARRWHGSPWVAAVLWAVPSTAVVLWDTQLGGARSAATLLSLCAVTVATGNGDVRGRWLGAGLLVGVAFYGDHLMVMWALPLALWAWREPGARVWLLSGALPPFVIDAGFALFTTGAMIAPQPPSVWLRNFALLRDVLPSLLGADWLSTTNHQPGSPTWYVASAAQAVVLLAIVIGAVRLSRKAPVGPLKPVVGTALIFFVLTARDSESVRYLIPAWPAVSILAAVVVGRWRPQWRLAVLVLPVATAHSLVNQTHWPTGAAAGAQCRNDAIKVESAMRSAGVQAAWTDYWTAFHLALLVDERVTFAPYTSPERRPDWIALAQRSHPVGYLVYAHAPQARETIIAAANAAGVSAKPLTIHAGSFDLVVLPSTLPASARQ